MPHREPQPQRHGEANEICGTPNSEDVEDILVPVSGVASDAALHPLACIPSGAEDSSFEDVEGGQVHEGQHSKVQSGLRSERQEPRAVAELRRPRLLGEFLDSGEHPLENIDLIPILKGSQIDSTEQAEDHVAFPVNFIQRLLLDHTLGHQIGS